LVFNEGEFSMEDKTIVCKDCGKDFVFTVGEQEFYKEKGFDNEPVRCPDCRRARKQQNNRR
jgi:ssDNA-binding Zn-finger/Zn-ribbon topoisomerase 1